MKISQFFKRFNEFCKTVGYIKIGVTGFSGVAITITQYLTGFFTVYYCVPVWVFPAIAFVVISLCLVFNFIAKKRTATQLFKPGDHVSLKDRNVNYCVIAYQFWKPDYVICVLYSDTKQLISLPQNAFVPYKKVQPRSGKFN